MIIERLSKDFDTIVIGFGENYNFFDIVDGNSAVLITNPNDPWYLTGIDGQDQAHISYKIDAIARYYKHSIFVGEGNAGYAAIYYGGMCGASKIVAFSPQTVLSPYKLFQMEDNRHAKMLRELYDVHGTEPILLDLPEIFRNFSRCYVYYCSDHTLDELHARNLPGAHVVEVKCNNPSNLIWWILPKIIRRDDGK